MALVKVLFDFEGQEAGELSIEAGSIVRISKMSQMPSSSGWILVETTSSPLSKGYVPAGYLSDPLDEEERITDNTVSHSKPKEVAEAVVPRIRRLSDPRLAPYLDETQEFLNQHKARVHSKDVTLPLPLQSTSKSPERFGTSSLVEFRRGQIQFSEQKVSEEELQRMLQRNDQWYSQVLDARRRRTLQTEQSLESLKKSLAHAREKSQDLASQLNRVGTDIEYKRSKLEKKLEEEERKRINDQFN